MDQSHTITNEDLLVMIEGASELVTQLQSLSDEIDQELKRGSSVDRVIEILNRQKDKVDGLRQISRSITSALGLDETGSLRQPIPEHLRIAFEDLMKRLTKLVETQANIESLLTSKGIPISSLTRKRR